MIVTDTVKAAVSSRNDVTGEGLESWLNAINPKDVAVTSITLIERYGVKQLNGAYQEISPHAQSVMRLWLRTPHAAIQGGFATSPPLRVASPRQICRAISSVILRVEPSTMPVLTSPLWKLREVMAA